MWVSIHTSPHPSWAWRDQYSLYIFSYITVGVISLLWLLLRHLLKQLQGRAGEHLDATWLEVNSGLLMAAWLHEKDLFVTGMIEALFSSYYFLTPLGLVGRLVTSSQGWRSRLTTRLCGLERQLPCAVGCSWVVDYKHFLCIPRLSFFFFSWCLHWIN